MRQYLNLVQEIINEYDASEKQFRTDRTGVGTVSVFGRQLRFNLEEGFPLVTTKKVHLKSIIYELLWFIRGETNISYLNKHGVTIWDEWADAEGELGSVYGKQWRRWEGTHGVKIDQLNNVILSIKNNPYSRRHLLLSYNPADIPEVAPPACHTLIQFYVNQDKLSLQLYQRSADLMLGVPFNIASYALLLQMVAQVTNLKPHEFVHTFGDVHIYSNHIDGAREQLTREPRRLPIIHINPERKNIEDFCFSDFHLEGYNPHPTIKFDIAV